MSNPKWLLGYLKKYVWGFVAVAVLNIALVICAFANPVMLGKFVDEVIEGAKTNLLVTYVLIILGAILMKETVTYVRQVIMEHISQSVVYSIRKKLFHKLQSMDCEFFDRTSTGDLMSRLTMDTEAIRVLIDGTIPSIFLQLCYIVIGFAIMLKTNVWLTLSLFATAPFIAVTAYSLTKSAKKTQIVIREVTSDLNTVVQENISGNRVVKAYAREDYEIEKFEKRNKNYRDRFMEWVHIWIHYGPRMHFFVKMTDAIFLLVGGFFVIRGIITPGQFTTMNGSLWCIVAPMASIGEFLTQIQTFNASSIKIRRLEDEQPKISNRTVLKRGTGIKGKVEFRNVTFGYEGGRTIKHLNFSCNPGDTVAIIGPTGSGKSTVVNLISRFYDVTGGAIFMDDIDIKNIDISTIRKNVAFAMQDIFLFSDTIHNNIAYGVPNATREDVIRVAKEADAHDFIMKTENGYDTIVGERGVGLSGGQRQRISLARALLKDPSILILDDTTSALDMETEYNIQKMLKENYSSKTKFIIAHRISSVKNADLILVLNQGNLIEWGKHECLLAQNGYYKGVFDDQFGDFNKTPKYHIKHPAYENMASIGGDFGGKK